MNRSAHRLVRILLPLIFLYALGACTRTPAIFWSDPFFELTQERSLKRRLRSVAGSNGFRLRIEKLPLQADYYNLVADQLERQQQPVVILTPLLFREAVILAENFPQRSIVLLGDRSERQPANLVTIRFVREESMRALGSRVAELLTAGERALIFFLDDTEQRRAELAALTLGYEPVQARIDLVTIQPDATEEMLAQRLQSAEGEQLSMLGLFLGPLQQLSRPLAVMNNVTLLLEDLGSANPFPNRVRLSIENDYEAAIAAALHELKLGSGRTTLRVPAQLVEHHP